MVFIVIALLALVVTIFYMRRTILRPLVQLRGHAIQLTRGDYAARCDIDTGNELAELGNIFNSMASAIEWDVTARKLAKESMRQATMVFENSSEAMMVTDADNIILSINPAFTRVTGYTPDEVLGKDPGIVDGGLHDESFLQAVQTSLDTTGHWEGEITTGHWEGEITSQVAVYALPPTWDRILPKQPGCSESQSIRHGRPCQSNPRRKSHLGHPRQYGKP